jgi:ATP-binding cassette subfamily B protein
VIGSPLQAPRNRRETVSPTWRERIAALRSIPQFLALAWRTHRCYAVLTVALRLLRALVPIVALWLGKLIIDAIVAARAGHPDAPRLWTLVALEMVAVLAGEALSKASTVIEGLFGNLCSDYISEKIIQHAATLDLTHFEDPAFYDRLERAQRQTTGRIGLLVQLLTGCQDIITLVSLASAITVYSPLLFCLLIASVLPGFMGEAHFTSLEYALVYRWTPERRRLDYLRFLSGSNRTIKEVLMLGLGDWLVKRYRALARRFYQEMKSLAIRKGLAATGLSLLGVLGYYAAYVVILSRGFYGVISIGTLTFLAASFSRSRDVSQRLIMTATNIYEQSLYSNDLFDFFATQPRLVSRAGALNVPAQIRGGIVFENVGFQYPQSDRWAIRNVSFQIRAGERLAIVGENGAGKTTIAKLLARLYDPTEGRILLDGVDLRDYDLASLRHAIGIIFQDFVRYDLRLDENIAVGEIDGLEDYLETADAKSGATEKDGHATHPSIASAAEKAQASSLAARLPGGYRQMLGHRFEKGVELSGGEWQKIALARAYIRNAQVIILDEPTAMLDPRVEYEVFARFTELVSGQMALLISHRFPTVRMADRIIVLRGGTVIEEGTHDELVARKGLYAELFSLQSEGYR